MKLRDVFDNCRHVGLHLVTPDDTVILQQLISDKLDKVHNPDVPFDMHSLVAARIGGLSQSHQTWVNLADDGEIKAALYTARFENPIETGQDLHGSVDSILTTPVHDVSEAAPKSLIFYSISSFARGAGYELISGVHSAMTCIDRSIVMSTLSPMRAIGKQKEIERNFKAWADLRTDGYLEQLSYKKKFLKALAMGYLSEGINTVQNFHMSKGAYIGDIKTNANKVESMDDMFAMNFMVNYVYPSSDIRAKLSEDFRQNGIVTIAPHLNGLAMRAQNPKVIRVFNP